MSRLNLPPGCRSVRMEDGTRYVARREGGHVDVADEHIAPINGMSGNGDGGLLHAMNREFGSTGGPTRVCERCGFRGYAFTATCPRAFCGGEMALQ